MNLSLKRSLLAQSLFIRWDKRVLLMALAFAAAVAGLLSPFFQKLFIDRLLQAASLVHGFEWLEWSETVHPVALIAVAFVFTMAAQGFGLISTYIAVTEGILLQRRFSDRLYRKMLAIRSDSLGKTTIGEVVSIYATDIPGATALIDQVLPMLASIVFPLVFAPLAIRFICGIELSSTLVVMAVIIAFNVVFSTRQSRFFHRFKQLAAERTGIVNEWIQNIRLLRILGWVESFEGLIFAKRREETKNRLAMVTNGQFMNAFGSSINFVINLVGVAALVYWRAEPVTPGELFALLWIFGVFLSRPFRQIPWFFTFTLDSLSSIRRVERFMNRPSDSLKEVELSGQSAANDNSGGAVGLRIRGLRLEAGSRSLLNGINLDIRAGEFVAVVGEVGSGKSVFVLSLAGETGATFDSFRMTDTSRTSPDGSDGTSVDVSDGTSVNVLKLTLNERRQRFAYVGQDGFVMSATLRENVMFRYEGAGNDAEVLKALELAQFRIDGEHLQNGLETEIGERGVNLSGGQRQRVALARAHFLRRPILLLDDCLSAVDVDTERKLIRHLIDGAWKDRTRILITHRLSVLEKVDRVLFIEDGQIIADGPFRDLVETNEKVQAFVASVRRGDVKSRTSESSSVSDQQLASQAATQMAQSQEAALGHTAGPSIPQETPDGQA